jgi:hypothetical protein
MFTKKEKRQIIAGMVYGVFIIPIIIFILLALAPN